MGSLNPAVLLASVAIRAISRSRSEKLKMFSHFSLLLLGLMSISNALAEDGCKEIADSTQVDQCAEIARQAADVRLNDAYKKLLARFESQQYANPGQGKVFMAMARDSQRAWIKLRDTNCPLEATDIEPGTAAHVTTINNCIARMSLERSDYLDSIVRDISGGSVHGEGVLAPQVPEVACPSIDFDAFLASFAQHTVVQKAFVQRPLQFVTTVAGDPEPTSEKRALTDAQIKFPLIPDRVKREIEGLTLTVKEQHEDSATVILQKPDTDYVIEYRFVRGQCWMLSEVSDFAL
jgi:uncharacterized protein YecT (DUF1311 family)